MTLVVKSTLAAALLLAYLAVKVWYFHSLWIETTDLAFFAKRFVRDAAFMAAWVAAWSWLSWQISGHARVLAHLCITLTAGLFETLVVAVALPWLFFALAWPWPHGLSDLNRAALILGVGLLQWRLAHPRFGLRQAMQWLALLAVALGLTLLLIWAERNDNESLTHLPFEPNIYPPQWIASPSQDLDPALKSLWGGGQSGAKPGW